MKTPFFLPMICGLLFIVSCNNSSENSGYDKQKIDIPKGWINLEGDNYSLHYPQGWFLDRSGQMGTSFLLFGPQDGQTADDEFKENISLIIEKTPSASINLEAYIITTTKQIKKMLTAVEIMSSEKITIGEMQGHKMVYTGVQGTLNLKFMQYFFLENQQAYVLTFTALQKDYDEYEKTITEIINTFQLK